MSHSTGTVLSADETDVLGYFEYDGTSDIACTAIWPNVFGVSAAWRTRANCRACTCGAPTTEVTLDSGYGGGTRWFSRACLSCWAITGETRPYGDDT